MQSWREHDVSYKGHRLRSQTGVASDLGSAVSRVPDRGRVTVLSRSQVSHVSVGVALLGLQDSECVRNNNLG